MVTTIGLWETATALATTAVITSDVIDQKSSKGYCSILVILAGTSPSVDITQTVARLTTDTFYAPYDGDGTAVGTITSGLAASRWIQFSPVIAPYFKITITGTVTNGANTTVRASLMFKEGTIIR